MTRQIYLDYAAATPLAPQVLEAMSPYFTQKFYNPSAQYLAARSIYKDISDARAKVAHWLGARPSEIVFTSGGTEANNLAIHGALRAHPDANIIVSGIEHDSVLIPAREYECKEAPVLPSGLVDVDELAKLIDERTVLVSVMYANNEIGTIQPVKRIADIIQRIREERRRSGNALPLYLHTDACQAANYLDLHVSRMGVDLMTINAGKIYGPKSSGALFIGSSVELHPQMLGGGQERGNRSGTEGVANIIGFATALELAQEMRHEEGKRLQVLQHLFFKLIKERFPTAEINGTKKQRLPNNIHVTFPGQDNERLIFGLDEAGVMCAAGSACSASKEEPSHVLRSIGLDDEAARSSLRFTLGRETDEAAIRATVDALAKLIV